MKPFVGEWIECHNHATCGNSLTFDGTRYHCSETCAAACLARRITRPPRIIAAAEVD